MHVSLYLYFLFLFGVFFLTSFSYPFTHFSFFYVSFPFIIFNFPPFPSFSSVLHVSPSLFKSSFFFSSYVFFPLVHLSCPPFPPQVLCFTNRMCDLLRPEQITPILGKSHVPKTFKRYYDKIAACTQIYSLIYLNICEKTHVGICICLDTYTDLYTHGNTY